MNPVSYPIVSTRISESTVPALRARTRQVSEFFGLDTLQTTRFVTAVSEIARNAVHFAGGGSATFLFVEHRGVPAAQRIAAVISDKGPGIEDLESALGGRLNANGEQALGIVGSRRLVDELRIESVVGSGTTVTIEMALPRAANRLSQTDLLAKVEELARQKPRTAVEELARQNQEMLVALQELKLRQTELEEADERKNQFLMTLAHELRNPLGTLEMILEIMRRSPDLDAEDLSRRRDAMARQTDQMTKLVDDMIDVARVSQGKVELVKRPLELNELVGQAIEMTGAAITKSAHRVTVTSTQGELWVVGDALRLKQVFVNLIHNAARYTPEGGRIDIALKREGDRACVSVKDTGIGIAAEILPHVFELFVQGGSGREPGGLGVGLTLVRKLVQGHGGTVVASSAGVGHGSEFVVRLPLG